MTKGHRLCDLHMGKARHDRARVLLSELQKRDLQIFQQTVNIINSRAQIQPNVGGDLIIT